MLSWIRSAGVVLSALVISACSGPPALKATPAVYSISDTDTVIYITGTVHLLPDNSQWRNGPIISAITDADELITELSPAELEKAPATAQQYMFAKSATEPTSRFDQDLRAAFSEFATDELPALSSVARYDDWALALQMAQSVARDAGLEGENGMDNALRDEFEDADKPHSGLETAADQFAAFDAIPAPEQRRMLNRIMRDIAEGSAEGRMRETVTAWSRGDVAALAAIVQRDMAVAPQTHRIMLTDRNARWAESLTARMAKPGRVLVAVGSGHLAGPSSLLEQLAAKGFTPRRLN
jgi:uncharacterized protein YbaP (TraB family)